MTPTAFVRVSRISAVLGVLCLASAARAQTLGTFSSPGAVLAPGASGAGGGAKYELPGDEVYHGASLPDTWDESGLRQQLQAYQQASGKKLAIITWFASLYQNGRFSSWHNDYLMPLRRVKALGAVSLVKFSVQDYMYQQNKKIATTKQIAEGVYDAYFDEAADAVKEFGSPVFISINHEMNGTWYPYSQDYPGSGVTAADYVAAWRHIVDIFRRRGANNVAWVWSPNVPDVGNVPFTSYYPGDDYVDWVGASFYSGNPMSNLNTIYKVYAAKKPIFITEWATGEDKNKYYQGFPGEASWIDTFFKTLQTNFPRVKAISWFEWDKRQYGESDYTLQRVAAQEAAYQKDIQNPRYLDSFSGTSTPYPSGRAPLQTVPVQTVPPEIVLHEADPVQQAPVSTPPVEQVRTSRPRLKIVPIETVQREGG